jgi:glutathione synthase/RimK-type ligase-like ATP-grasp enzyme
MTPEVLILSSLFDFSSDLIALRLRDMRVPFLRLNREQLSDFRLTLDPLKARLHIRGRHMEAEVNDSLRSILFRQPVFLRNTPNSALSVSDQMERSQWAAFMRTLSVFDRASWMNFPQATYLAECKPYQLLTAARCGFRVPESIVTNDVGAIRDTYESGFVVKSLDTVLLREGQDCLFAYTTVIDGSEAALTDANVAAAPLLAQEFLSAKTDIRVTVVGNKVFAVKILCKGEGVEGDWRLFPKESLTYEDVKLSPDIVTACRLLLRTLGLAFGAIDLIETAAGTYFIEVNPTGEWAWISTSERPIDLVIAGWLSGSRGYGEGR